MSRLASDGTLSSQEDVRLGYPTFLPAGQKARVALEAASSPVCVRLREATILSCKIRSESSSTSGWCPLTNSCFLTRTRACKSNFREAGRSLQLASAGPLVWCYLFMASTSTYDTQRRDGDRRLHPRRRLDRLSYIDFGSDNGGMVIDISEGGLSFQGGGPFWKHQSLRLRFLLPGLSSKLIEATGRDVVQANRTGKGGGLQFVEISEEARKPCAAVDFHGRIRRRRTARRLNIFGATETASATRRFPGDSRTAENKNHSGRQRCKKNAADTAKSTRKAGESLAAPQVVPAAPPAVPARSEALPRRVERASGYRFGGASASAARASSNASAASRGSAKFRLRLLAEGLGGAANARDPHASETSADVWGDGIARKDGTIRRAWTSGSTSPDSSGNAEGDAIATPSDDITKRALSLIAKAQSLTPGPTARTVSTTRPSQPIQST